MRALASAVALLAALLPTGAAAEGVIRVGSKSFTESYILAEVVAQVIEQAGEARAERRVGLGGTGLTQRALESGAIDVYPEYTGTLARVILKDAALRTVEALRARLEPMGLTISGSLGFANTYALAVRADAGRAPRAPDRRRPRAPPGAARRLQLRLPRARRRLAGPARPLRARARPGGGDGARGHLSRDRERPGGRHGRVLHRRPARAAAPAPARGRPALLPRLLGGAARAPRDDRAVPPHLGAAAGGARGPARRGRAWPGSTPWPISTARSVPEVAAAFLGGGAPAPAAAAGARCWASWPR